MKTYTSEFAEVEFVEEANAVIVIWKKAVTEQSYKDTFTAVLESIKQNKASAFISDITHQGIVGTNSRKWLQETIIPQAIQHGLAKVGTVVPEDIFQKFYVDKVKDQISKVKTSVAFQYFTSIEEAKNWTKVPVAS